MTENSSEPVYLDEQQTLDEIDRLLHRALLLAHDRFPGSYGPNQYVPNRLRHFQSFYDNDYLPAPKRKPRSKVAPAVRRQMMNMAECARCGTRHDLEIDHIKPLSRGGTSAQTNLQILCHDCNQKKGAKTMKEMGW